MPAKSEAPTGIKEHKVKPETERQRADEMFRSFALAHGVDTDAKGEYKISKIVEDDKGKLIEVMDLTHSTRIETLSVLRINRPGAYSLEVEPWQIKSGMMLEGGIVFTFPNGQKLRRSEEAYAEARKAVSASLQLHTPQS